MNIYHQILQKYWNFSEFRPLQENIILSVANGHDVLVLMPTGGGKSLTFQVPALAKEGVCIVITPLIALMKDQVEGLKKKGIKAVSIHSGMYSDEMETALDNCIFGNYKFLYISPERIGTELFRVRVQDMKVNLIAVDEAHCISQWGYDFRPSYLRIADIRKLLPGVPVLGLTATATPQVAADIQEKLLFKNKNQFTVSFERKNIVYLVRHTDDKQKYILKIVNSQQGCGIIYTRSRKKTKEIAGMLLKNRFRADYYHAGLSTEKREYVQNQWKNNHIKIIVATNAFGMGIDKADVRFVIHADIPHSPEEYFQEAGRAGRDGKKAYAVLLFSDADRGNLEKSIDVHFPEPDKIRKVYQSIGNYFQLAVGSGKNMVFDFRISEFCSVYKMAINSVYYSLKILEKEGYIEFTEELNVSSRIRFIVDRDELYKFQVANASFDGFIKLLLRSYSGVFSDYVNIDEDILAKRSNTQRDIIYKYLQNLVHFHIIKYIPQRRSPLLIFTEERLDEKSIFISKENYLERKKKYQQRIHAMVQYATTFDVCRSILLLRYFGESDDKNCGQCDVCTHKNEMGLSRNDFENMMSRINDFLKAKEMTMEELVDQMGGNTDKAIKVIQWMLDNKKLQYNEMKKIIPIE